MAGKKILAIGAHPDDIELGCGGTIAKHLERGDEVFVLVMTNGDQGLHTPNRKECFNSLGFLGVKKENIFFGNLPDGYIEDKTSTVNIIEKIIKKMKIERVYTHYPHDRHQDHRNCSYAVGSAARKVKEIFLFEGPSTKVPFEPHYFISIKPEHFKKKIKALARYQTQTQKGIVNLRAIKSLAAYHGSSHNAKYAEAFAINHMVRDENDV